MGNITLCSITLFSIKKLVNVLSTDSLLERSQPCICNSLSASVGTQVSHDGLQDRTPPELVNKIEYRILDGWFHDQCPDPNYRAPAKRDRRGKVSPSKMHPLRAGAFAIRLRSFLEHVGDWQIYAESQHVQQAVLGAWPAGADLIYGHVPVRRAIDDPFYTLSIVSKRCTQIGSWKVKVEPTP